MLHDSRSSTGKIANGPEQRGEKLKSGISKGCQMLSSNPSCGGVFTRPWDVMGFSWDFQCVCLFLAVYSVYHGGFPCVSADLKVTNPLSQTGPSHMVRHRPPSPRAGHAEEPLRPQNSLEAPQSLSNSLAEKAFRCFYVVTVCTVQHVSYLFQAELSSKLKSL